MKLLFVDDQRNSVEDAIMQVEESIADVVIRFEDDFADVGDIVNDFHPDIIIIDLVDQLKVGLVGEFLGIQALKSIWEMRFMPMIVYSGRPELLDDEIRKHPLVDIVTKGPDSDLDVVKSVDRLRDVVESLKETRTRIETELSVVLRDVAPTVFVALEESERSVSEAIERACFRRLAAIVDDPNMEYGRCESWEQYVFPPISDALMLGDLLRLNGAPSDDPNGYRVVLTPSCDMASHPSPKVTDALLARCRPWRDRLDSLQMKGAKRGGLIRRLPSILNRGFQDSIIPLPSLPGKIPGMVVDLRDLSLEPLNSDGGVRGFCRVASVDSPFRELVSWAYIQMSGRPGLPVRDVQGWAEGVADELEA